MNTSAAAARKTDARDKRHQQLIDATIRAISQHGLSKTTLAQVGQIAGQSPSIVNFYFNSKEQLFLAVLDSLASEYSRKMMTIFAAADEPAVTVTNMIEASFDKKLCTTEKVSVWYAFSGESRARKDYLRICGDKDAETGRQLQKQFVILCEQEGQPEKDARVLAAGLEGLIQHYWETLLYAPATFNRDNAIADCLSYMHQLFPGQFSGTARQMEISDNINDSEKTSDLLPVWTYQNREFFDLEINRIFRRHWMLTGHVNDIPATGDYFTFDCFGERALIVRAKNGDINAFHNVCQHRGARLAEQERGNCPRRFVCPFHGWSYHLDGRLQMVPMAKTFPGLKKSEIRLASIECSIWHGFIFIRFDSGGPDISEQLQSLEEIVAPYRLEDMHTIKKPSSSPRPYNWKIIHDIDNEGYHVPIGHPGLQSLYGGKYEDYEHEGFPMSVGFIRPPAKNDTWSAAAYKKILPDFPHLPEKNQRSWIYAGIFPNTVLVLYPDMAEFYMTIPETPEKTRFCGGTYGLPDDRRAVRLARYLNDRINRETDAEDDSFVRWMQEGMSSSAFPEFKLSQLEQGVRDFHKKIQAALPVASLANPPTRGEIAEINKKMTARHTSGNSCYTDFHKITAI